MNTFALKTVVLDMDTAEEDVPLVTHQIWIDGEQLDETFAVDLRALFCSLFAPGRFHFLTCGCGDAGCAGFEEGFSVRHEPGRIRWRYRLPLSDRDIPIKDDEERLRVWREQSTVVEQVFERAAFVATLEHARETALATPGSAEFSPYGMTRSRLASLSSHRHPSDHREPSGRRYLHFLADEANPWLLEGHFVSPTKLGLAGSLLRKIDAWRESGKAQPLEPTTRIAWLEEARRLLLGAYDQGLTPDIDLRLVAQLRSRTQSALDPWAFDIRELDRTLLEVSLPLEAPYLCLSAEAGSGFQLWFDDSPECQESRSRFVGNGAKVYGSILVPFELEQALSGWATNLPGTQASRDADPVALWDLDPDRCASTSTCASWADFNQSGMALAGRLQEVLGQRATVLYEVPWCAPDGVPRQRVAPGQ